MSRRCRALAVLLLLSLVFAPHGVSAQPADSKPTAAADAVGRVHFQRGQRLSASGNYAGAYREFAAGYAATKRPLFLFNMGEAARASGDVAKARESYLEFLRVDPNSALAATARTRLAELDRVAGTPQSGTPQSGTPQSGTPQSGTSQSGTSQSGTSQSGTPQSGTSQSGTSRSGTSQSGTSQSGTSRSGTSRTGTSPTGTSPTGTSQSGTSQSSTSQSSTSQSGTSQSGTSRTGTSPTGTSQSSTSQSGTSQSGTSRTGTSSTGTAPTGTAPTGTAPTGTAPSTSAVTTAPGPARADLLPLQPPSAVPPQPTRPSSDDGLPPDRFTTSRDTEDRPLWKKWPFWAVVGVGAIAGGAIVYAATRPGGNPCTGDCTPLNFRSP
jgi:hypothetical protein